MPVPTYDRFIEPLLRHLAKADPPVVRVADAYEVLANHAGLTVEDREALLPSGRQPIYKNRILWAQDRLKRAGLSNSPARGIWTITEEGLKLANRYGSLPPKEIERIASAKGGERTAADALPAQSPGSLLSPEERIASAHAELEASVARDLKVAILECSPLFFENLVLDLLLKLGYGATPDDLRRVGGSGDGGIDGIITLDTLGLEKVHVQAKRWRNAVGSPEIQGFMGALQLQGASKGILLTTSEFTRSAIQAAERARGALVLIDGDRLTRLMIRHGVGVQYGAAYRIPRIDRDAFEDE